jgi:hypothetical protein
MLRILKDETGQDLIEYALMVALIPDFVHCSKTFGNRDKQN